MQKEGLLIRILCFWMNCMFMWNKKLNFDLNLIVDHFKENIYLCLEIFLKSIPFISTFSTMLRLFLYTLWKIAANIQFAYICSLTIICKMSTRTTKGSNAQDKAFTSYFKSFVSLACTKSWSTLDQFECLFELALSERPVLSQR